MAEIEGRCPSCGKIHLLRSPKDLVICDCWQHCPICGAEMTPYMPDTASKTYALNGLRELQVLTACFRHYPPFFSTQKPMEVKPNA